MSAGSFRLFEIVGVKLQKKSAIFGSILGPDGTKVRSRKNCALSGIRTITKKAIPQEQNGFFSKQTALLQTWQASCS
ncbi:MAG: hypothetical protein R2792_18510 [Saprospiraceae bacterium]